jgi:MinD-like ATPase involved in chromosome partitioning or flagellar assembly
MGEYRMSKKVLLGYQRADYQDLYSALANRGLSIVGVANSKEKLCQLAEQTSCDVVVLWANMASSPGELQGTIQTLMARAPVAVILPHDLAHAKSQVEAMQPAPTAVWVNGENEVEAVAGSAAGLVKQLASRQQAESSPTGKVEPRSAFAQASPASPPVASMLGDAGDNGAKRGPAPKLALAVWSGSAGGTGKSTIAAELAALASERAQTVLVGLNEPGGIVAGLGVRPRPDLLDVIDEGAEPQRRARLGLIPAPSEPGRAKAMLERVGELAMLLGSLAGAYDVAVFDMPPAMVGTPVREVIGAATMLLYVMRPIAADGAVAARVLAALAHMTRQPVRLVWNATQPQGGSLAPKEVQQGVEAAAVAFPDVIGSVPYHKGVVAARDRQQLLCEAEADGLVPAAVTDAVKAIAGSLFGWEPEPGDKSTFRLPGIKLKVVD